MAETPQDRGKKTLLPAEHVAAENYLCGHYCPSEHAGKQGRLYQDPHKGRYRKEAQHIARFEIYKNCG